MDLFMPGERVELFDACLHIMATHQFARRDRGEVNLWHDALVRLDDLVVDVDTELLLSSHYRNPQLAFQHDLGHR